MNPSNTRPRIDRIRDALNQTFQPATLDVVDDSSSHAGHAGASASGETHYLVTIVSQAFAGKGRVERHRLVNAALSSEFSSGLHALALKVKAPGE